MAGLIHIDDDNYLQHIEAPQGYSKGHVPRNFETHPVGYLACAKPFDLALIDESTWQARLDAQKAANARLIDIRNAGMFGAQIPSRDQNGKGYCWAHSSTSAALLVRALNNQPYADLSAYAVACQIKNFRDEGGWGAESLEYIAANGIPTSKTWPQQSMDRSNVNDAMKADAALHKFEEWMDLDPNQMKAQLVTCLLLNIPVVVDFNWWGHSVCAVAIESFDPFTIWIWNSWGNKWSEAGMGKLTGSKAMPDAAVAPRVMIASAA